MKYQDCSFVWNGDPGRYRTQAALSLEDDNRYLKPWSWVIALCDTPMCLETDHLRIESPTRIAYPSDTCACCGQPATSREVRYGGRILSAGVSRSGLAFRAVRW